MILIYTWLLATAFYYLGSRTLVTRWFWSRMPPKVYEFLSCPMCAPFWYTLAIVNAALGLGYSYPGFNPRWNALIALPFSSIVVVPILAGLIEWGLSRVYSSPEEAAKPEGSS